MRDQDCADPHEYQYDHLFAVLANFNTAVDTEREVTVNSNCSVKSKDMMAYENVLVRRCWYLVAIGAVAVQGFETTSLPCSVALGRRHDPLSSTLWLKKQVAATDLEVQATKVLSKMLVVERVPTCREHVAALHDDSLLMLNEMAKEETYQGTEKAQQFLERLQTARASDLTSKHYIIVMEAWVKIFHIDRAETCYQHLVLAHQEAVRCTDHIRSVSLNPNCFSLNVFLWSSIREGRLDRAEAWLERMEQSEDSNHQPQTDDYNALLCAYARRRGRAQSAERIVKRMVDRCKEREILSATTMGHMTCPSSSSCAPNLCSYNALLRAHANSDEGRGAGQRARRCWMLHKPKARISGAILRWCRHCLTT
jgi:hypothetical protein